jgi:hypothetical protein
MKPYEPLVIRLACVALVVCIVIPLGKAIFPHIANEIGDFSFATAEALISATLGFGIYAALFG